MLFEASNHHTKQSFRIEAKDGLEASKIMAQKVGIRQWHGGFEIPLPNAWQILCVCPICGKTSGSYQYCSEKCFLNAAKQQKVEQ